MTAVAVVGLGAMGSRVAGRLLDAGHELLVWNRTASKTLDLTARGAVAVETPGEAARRAEAVITTVRDPSALAAVTEGDDGVAAGARSGATVVEMSTVGPAAIARLASALPEGVDLLDAPVLGSISEAEAGSLHVFVGGRAELFERCRPLLSVLGSPLHVGPLGSGAAAKLVVNTTLFGVIAVLGEALALADAVGLSRESAFDVLSATPISTQAERRRAAIETGEFPRRFALSLARKDADLIADAASGIDLRVAEAARTWLADAEAAGLGGLDYSAVLARIMRTR